MQHYTITFTGYTTKGADPKPYNYCFFSLPIERANTLIPLDLLNIDIHEETIYAIGSKVIEGVFKLVHNLSIKNQVNEWLTGIGAQHVTYIHSVGLKIDFVPKSFVSVPHGGTETDSCIAGINRDVLLEQNGIDCHQPAPKYIRAEGLFDLSISAINPSYNTSAQ